MTNSLLHMGDWSIQNMDAYALLDYVGTVDPLICQTAWIFLSHISLKSYHLELMWLNTHQTTKKTMLIFNPYEIYTLKETYEMY